VRGGLEVPPAGEALGVAAGWVVYTA